MSPRFEAPRGTHDILPAEQPRWRRVTGEMEELCGLYGYRRIDTPAIEDTDLILRTSGAGSDVVQKETYTFADRGGRSLTLRPEGTAPICRAYVEHGLHREPQPQKLYTIAPMWRYDRPQKGRYREHWQLSVEAIGSDDPAIDAELIQLYVELLRRLGVTGWELRLNSIGDRACRPEYVERLSAWLDAHDHLLDEEARAKRQTSPLRVFDVRSERVHEALRGAPTIGESLCEPCRAHFLRVQEYLESYRVPFVLAPALVRGLDYYTRTTFEFHERGTQILGGGRYDYLVEEIGGPPTPAIGFGAGIERLLLSVDATDVPAPAVDVFFAFDGDVPRGPALALMGELRRSGVSADTDYAGRSLKGQLTQAGRLRARTTVVVDGEGARVRREGAEERVPLDGLAARLR